MEYSRQREPLTHYVNLLARSLLVLSSFAGWNGIRVVTISSGRCLKACHQNSECRDGYTCSPFGGPNLEGGDGACTPLKDEGDAGAP